VRDTKALEEERLVLDPRGLEHYERTLLAASASEIESPGRYSVKKENVVRRQGGCNIRDICDE